jgi:glycosyltransferase involved in cell wall biosynthesis
VKRFSQQGHQRSRALNGTIELLYAGQIVEHKGVHTAIEAMAKVANGPGKGMAHLTIIGSGHPAYESRLRYMVAEGGLQECVQFEGHVSPTKIPATLCEYDVLIFPSIYDEPLARITQEAMASNMVVIGTTTGGTSEILSDGITGLTFPAGDADALSRQIQQLLREPGLAGRLAVAGRQRVLSYFNLERMVNEIEAYLQEVVEGLPPDHEALPNQSYA